jgi:hypothetical protein
VKILNDPTAGFPGWFNQRLNHLVDSSKKLLAKLLLRSENRFVRNLRPIIISPLESRLSASTDNAY